MERKFNWGVVLGLALLGFARSVGWSLNKGLSFPLLSSYTESAFIKGTILAAEGLIGLFIPVLLGYYSDTLRSRHGRRRPFIMVGGVLSGIRADGLHGLLDGRSAVGVRPDPRLLLPLDAHLHGPVPCLDARHRRERSQGNSERRHNAP